MKNLKTLKRSDLKKIVGGLHDFVVYDPSDPCQNWTEIAPVGCACTSDSQCPTRFGPGATSSSGSVTLAGACVSGVCAGSVGS